MNKLYVDVQKIPDGYRGYVIAYDGNLSMRTEYCKVNRIYLNHAMHDANELKDEIVRQNTK